VISKLLVQTLHEDFSLLNMYMGGLCRITSKWNNCVCSIKVWLPCQNSKTL